MLTFIYFSLISLGPGRHAVNLKIHNILCIFGVLRGVKYYLREEEARDSRTFLAAFTMALSARAVSFQPRVLSPQSGLTHMFSAGRTSIAFLRRPFISSSVGTRGEWMS